MKTPLDSMRIIHWASGAPMSSQLPISDPDPDPGLLGPDSLSWRLHEEQWLITAGARAFLLQAAHPKVAQGALEHSGFAEDPFGRVYSTIRGMAILIFGTTHEANAMARHINRLHHTVQGTLPESIGRYTAGETYSGMEPLALLWVHIVFVDSMLTAYKTFVGPLSEAECEQYWQESCRYARLLGLTDTTLPTSYAAVQQYIREALASGEIAIGPAAHFIAQKVLYPPMPLVRKPLWTIVRLITVGQLPSDIRQAYGLRWTTRHRVGFRIARGVGHLLRRLFPNALGRSPLVNFARSRARGEFRQSTEPVPSANDGSMNQHVIHSKR
ncbi:MAG TPA: oxygenase MpaB family protein [Ktedonobacteraceae bacterium]|nr:oxygenase MpaB family protein [Ktedonobacteraceae bacterium]